MRRCIARTPSDPQCLFVLEVKFAIFVFSFTISSLAVVFLFIPYLSGEAALPVQCIWARARHLKGDAARCSRPSSSRGEQNKSSLQTSGDAISSAPARVCPP